MKGHTIASRARRRLELKAKKSMLYNPQISTWIPATPENIAWLAVEVERSQRPRHTPWKVIEQRKDGKKTGLIALARVT